MSPTIRGNACSKVSSPVAATWFCSPVSRWTLSSDRGNLIPANRLCRHTFADNVQREENIVLFVQFSEGRFSRVNTNLIGRQAAEDGRTQLDTNWMMTTVNPKEDRLVAFRRISLSRSRSVSFPTKSVSSFPRFVQSVSN